MPESLMDGASDGIIEVLQRLVHAGEIGFLPHLASEGIIHIYIQNGGNYGCQTDYRQTSE